MVFEKVDEILGNKIITIESWIAVALGLVGNQSVCDWLDQRNWIQFGGGVIPDVLKR